MPVFLRVRISHAYYRGTAPLACFYCSHFISAHSVARNPRDDSFFLCGLGMQRFWRLACSLQDIELQVAIMKRALFIGLVVVALAWLAVKYMSRRSKASSADVFEEQDSDFTLADAPSAIVEAAQKIVPDAIKEAVSEQPPAPEASDEYEDGDDDDDQQFIRELSAYQK